MSTELKSGPSVKSGRPKTNNDIAAVPLSCFIDDRGSLTPVERKALPFDINRVYFVHDVECDTIRGDHGHYRTHQILIALEGKISIKCYDGITQREFVLDTSEKGLHVPPGIWTTNHHSKGSVMCVLADRPYDARDYIEDRSVFKRWKRCQPFFGSFDSFSAIGQEDALENKDWLTYQVCELEKALGGDADPELVSALSDNLVVLDFGGSLGHSYLKIVNSTELDVEYHIVETRTMVDAGKELFPDHKHLSFHVGIPELPLVDVVYSRTALQYVDDWRNVLEGLASLGAEYMILSDTQAGNIPTFAGVQNWYGHFVPNWFFNVDELLGAIPGYDLQRLTPGMRVNMTNYPTEQRLTNACNLILKRRES